jgi:hypothetical protein
LQCAECNNCARKGRDVRSDIGRSRQRLTGCTVAPNPLTIRRQFDILQSNKGRIDEAAGMNRREFITVLGGASDRYRRLQVMIASKRSPTTDY